jgi:hypothetical protein
MMEKGEIIYTKMSSAEKWLANSMATSSPSYEGTLKSVAHTTFLTGR